MDNLQFFKSIVKQDTSAVVICDTAHTIIYMNQSACEKYAKYGGLSLVGKSLLDCHNAQSNEMIIKVLDWFKSDKNNNRIHSFYNQKENKDVYIIALRNEQDELIGYYEKHEYRNRDTEPFYNFGG